MMKKTKVPKAKLPIYKMNLRKKKILIFKIETEGIIGCSKFLKFFHQIMLRKDLRLEIREIWNKLNKKSKKNFNN